MQIQVITIVHYDNENMIKDMDVDEDVEQDVKVILIHES